MLCVGGRNTGNSLGMGISLCDGGQQTLSIKGQIVNISGFVSHMASVATTWLYNDSMLSLQWESSHV